MWGGKTAEAKARQRARHKKWVSENRARVNAQSLERYHKLRCEDPTTSRRYKRRAHLKSTYGIALEFYDALLATQNGVCAVCHQPETELRRGTVKSLDVDHNHDTGQIRGLLCSACNTALGLLREDPLRIKALFEYIERANDARSS